MDSEEYTYEPIEGKPKRKRRKSQEPPTHSSGYHLEFDQGQVMRPIAKQRSYPVEKTSRREILYVLRPDKMPPLSASLVLDLWWRPLSLDGTRQPCKPLVPENGMTVPDKADSEMLDFLDKCDREPEHLNRHNIPLLFQRAFMLLSQCAQGKHVYRADNSGGGLKIRQIAVNTIFKYSPAIDIRQSPDASFAVRAYLSSEYNKQLPEIDFSQVICLLAPGGGQTSSGLPTCYALLPDSLVPIKPCGDLALFQQFIGKGTLFLDYAAALSLAKRIAMESELPTDKFPLAVAFKQESGIVPRGELYIRTAKYKYKDAEQLHAELSFNYGGITCPDNQESKISRPSSVILRDAAAENQLKERLKELGFRYNTRPYQEELGWKLLPSQLEDAVNKLVQEEWTISAEGKTYRKPSSKSMSIVSGIDWFSMDAFVQYGNEKIPLPALLSIMRNGQKSVRLDDGTYGVLPIEWLANFTVLTEIGDVDNEKIRFRAEQASIVAAILGERDQQASECFTQQLQAFEALGNPTPAKPPDGFKATLRPYQELGLGWLKGMQKAGLGACLADDMGLGKTIQVLAILGERSRLSPHRPSLIVLPFSLIFNWQAEAAKFAPWLRSYVFHGTGRRCEQDFLYGFDLIFTTYGTLRNDAIQLSKVKFDYCVLDESQAIKNGDSSTAMACRCIDAQYRIAMTGTPIENHLGELFSQLTFLNPGLFGHLKPISIAPSVENKRDDGVLNRVRRGVRPFILRRTKQQVAKDLPPKTEQILWCEMPQEDMLEYEELLKYYQNELNGEDNPQGSGMQVLAALTHLRQAACHPGLLKNSRIRDTSAKLETLCANMQSIIQSGHKALVFSQFTSFLKIIQARFEEYGYGLCYLDGETKDRAQVVEQFQNDTDKQVFLISLKAGGVGLNLTAADYVFLMDPWWNPAIEAQAIDRAYRIGQKNRVIAYRMVTRGTIEEKVVQLQDMKRKLATAVMDGEPVLQFTANDLRNLLR